MINFVLTKHIHQLCQDLTKIVCAFRIVKYWVPKKEKLKLYYAYFHSKIQYGIELYGTASKKLIKKLAVMQHRAIKALFNLDPLTSSANMHKIYKILNIDDLYAYKTIKFVHKQHLKDQNIFSNYFATVANENYPNTRNRNNLAKPSIQTENERKMMKYMGAHLWNEFNNKLKSNLTNVSSGKLDRMLKNYFYRKYETFVIN